MTEGGREWDWKSWLSMQAKLDLWWAAGKPAQVEVFEGVGAILGAVLMQCFATRRTTRDLDESYEPLAENWENSTAG